MRRLARLLRRHPLIALGFGAALLAFAVFAFALLTLPPPWHRDGQPPPLAGWMTPKFVLHAYDLPPDLLGAALGLEPGSRPRQTLDQIATARGIPVSDLIARIEALIADLHPLPPGAPPGFPPGNAP